MSDEVSVEGVSLAPGVVETIISIAVKDINGVASVGTTSTGGLLSLFPSSKPATDGIEIDKTDDGRLLVAVHLEATYGSVLPEIAAEVRSAVAEAVRIQVGVEVAAVDVYIDAIRFD